MIHMIISWGGHDDVIDDLLIMCQALITLDQFWHCSKLQYLYLMDNPFQSTVSHISLKDFQFLCAKHKPIYETYITWYITWSSCKMNIRTWCMDRMGRWIDRCMDVRNLDRQINRWIDELMNMQMVRQTARGIDR